MRIQDFLTVHYLGEGDLSCVDIDPRVQYAHYVGEEGAPQRVRATVRVDVPLYEWADEQENDIIFRVMSEASKGYPVRAQTFGALTHQFWAKRRGNLSVFAYHPSLEGRFSVPSPTVVFHSEVIDPDRVLCIGSRDVAGTLLIREEEGLLVKNYVATAPTGVLSVLVSNP
jgi:hypothetical protein